MKLFTILTITIFLCFQSLVLNAQLEENDLTWDGLKQAFNDLEDKPVIVSVLGVNCPPCRTHRDDIRDQVMNQCDNTDLQWFIVWFEDPWHPAVRADAVGQAPLINDDRVTQWWYTEHQSNTAKNDSIAFLLGDASWMGMGCNYAWDISMLFEAGATWDAEPPQPNYCMNKGGVCCNSYNINNFVNAVIDLEVCDQTTAINKLQTDSELAFLECYPNPVLQYTTIHYRHPATDGLIIISDAKGNKIKTYNLTQREGEVELSENLTSGVYYYSLWTKGRLLKQRKMVVLRN